MLSASSMALRVCNIVAVGKCSGVKYSELEHYNSPSTVAITRRARKSFNGYVLRVPGLCTVIIFPNGAITAVGIKNFAHIARIMPRLCRVLPGVVGSEGVVCTTELRVCNIVGSMAYNNRIKLSALHGALRDRYHLTYEPEVFPGMTITVPKTILCTGGTE